MEPIANFKEIVKHFMNLSKVDKQKVMGLFMDETEDATFLDISKLDIVVPIADEAYLEDNIYKFFGISYTNTQLYIMESKKCYVNDCNYDNFHVLVVLNYDEEEIGNNKFWYPVILFKEFWDFYSYYINEKNTDIKNIANNLVEYIDKIQGVITYLADMNIPKEDISFLIQKTISSWIKK